MIKPTLTLLATLTVAMTPVLSSAQGMPNFLPTALGGGENGVIHGDFGYSIQYGRPVLDMILERVPATLLLMGTAFLIWVSIAIVLGVIAAVKRYSLFGSFQRRPQAAISAIQRIQISRPGRIPAANSPAIETPISDP